MLTKVEHQTEAIGFPQKLKDGKKKKEKVTKFIEILFGIFEGSPQQDVFSWTPDGLGILILNHVEFADKILPKYFKHSNFASFIRQLNIYGFKKIKSEACDNHYIHGMFRRGHKELLSKIKRKKVAMKDHKNPMKRPEVSGEGSTADQDRVLQENQILKKQQRDMAENMVLLNEKIQKLSSDNDYFSERCMAQCQQIERLKMMIMPTRGHQHNPNLNPLLGHDIQQMTSDFSFPGASQQLSNFVRTTQPQAASKQHFQMNPTQLPQQQQALQQHQQLFPNQQQLMMRQQQIIEAMRLFPGTDPGAFGGSNLKLSAHSGLPTDHLTDPIELLDLGEMQGHPFNFK